MASERIKHFTQLKVWQKAHYLFLDALKDVEVYPKLEGARIVTSQVLRSIGSIGANIAEGFNAKSTKQYAYCLDIARRTAAESENWYFKVRDAGYLPKDTANKRIKECIEISKMIQAIINKLKMKESDEGRGDSDK